MKSKVSLEDFNKMPVLSAVLKNAIPAMITMIMFLVYNLADTFFIGLTHDDLQIASISLATPLFMLFTAFATIFGMGGTSVIARALGRKETAYVKKVSSFCMWSSTVLGVVIGLIFFVFGGNIVTGLGASSDTYPYAFDYVRIIAFCGPFAMISNTFSKILMADGQPKKAMAGSMIGNLLNIILDPIFILVLNMNVAGAAIATLVSNVVAAGYYIVYFMKEKNTSLSISPRDFTIKENVFQSVFSIGIPAALGPLVMGISVMFINSLASSYSDMALAGVGISLKFTMVTGMVCMGIGQGVQPLLGFCIGAKNKERYKETLKVSLIFALVFGIVVTGVCYLFTNQIAGLFLTSADSFEYAVHFAHILLTTSSLFGVFYVLLNSLQAMGAAIPSLIVNLSRQGLIYIPSLYIMNAVAGIDGLVWAQPIADILSIILVAFLSISKSRKLLNIDSQSILDVDK